MKKVFGASAVLCAVSIFMFGGCGEGGGDTYTLAVSQSGQGTYSLSPKSTAVTERGNTYPGGTKIRLEAEAYPSSGWQFLHFIDVFTGQTVTTNPYVFNLNNDRALNVVFTEEGGGSGTVSWPASQLNWTNPFSTQPVTGGYNEFIDRFSVDASKNLVIQNAILAQIWDLQVYQEGFNYTSGDFFKLRIKARVVGSGSRRLQAGIQLNAQPYTTYATSDTVVFSSSVSETKDICVRAIAGNVSDPNAKLYFSVGSNAAGGTLYIESVEVIKSNSVECAWGSSGGDDPVPTNWTSSPASQIGWTNAYSAMPVTNSSSFPTQITLNASNRLVIAGRTGVMDPWDIQIGQSGFNYTPTGASMFITSYLVTISGNVTGGSVTFNMGIQYDGSPYTTYVLSEAETIPNGTFTRTIELWNVPDFNSINSSAKLYMNLGYSGNGTMTINSLQVSR